MTSRLSGVASQGVRGAPSLLLTAAEGGKALAGVAAGPQLPGFKSWLLPFQDLD